MSRLCLFEEDPRALTVSKVLVAMLANEAHLV